VRIAPVLLPMATMPCVAWPQRSPDFKTVYFDRGTMAEPWGTAR
jgi:hypothetical protein